MDRHKVMQNVLKENAHRRRILQQRPELKHLFFEVTTRCNLQCLHCGSSCSAQNCHDISETYIIKTLQSVKEHCKSRFPLLCITGGEPMLYEKLIPIMTYASGLGFKWGMTTNATLINDENARALYDSGLVSTTVSVDGLGKNHDWFRNTPGSFSKMQKGIKALVDNAPPETRVDVITVVNKRNLSQMEDIYQFISDKGIKSWRVVNMEPIGRALQNKDIMLESDDYKKLFEFIEEKHFNSKFIDIDYGCSHYLTFQYERMLRPYCFTCIAGLQVASVAWNGDIIACLDIERRPELVQGNVINDDFWSVWTKRFEFFRHDRTDLNDKCMQCEDREYCAGDSAHTWDYDNNEPLLCMKDILQNIKRGYW